MRQQEQRLTRGARLGRLYLAGLGAASCQAILALILIAQWQGHKQLSAAPVGLAIISVPLTMALIGFVLYAAWSKQPGGAAAGLSRAVAPTAAVAPIQVAAPIAEATPPPPAPVTVAPPDPDTLAAGMSGQTTLKRLDIKAGVASFPLCGRSPEDLIGAANEALSRTKGEGHNRVAGATVEILPPEAVAAVPTALDAVGLATVEAFAIAVDAKDAYTQGHSQRVSTYSEAIGRAMGLPEIEVQHLRLAGLLHDVGKIGVPDAILTKLGALTDSEYAVLQQHTAMGHRMVLAVPPLRNIAGAARHHHERWDGAGYPDGITADEIPRDAAIVMVADSFDAMTSSRMYQPALRLSEARRRVREGSGTQFDPRVVEAFERAFEQGTLRPLSPGGTLPLPSTYVARASHGITAPQK